mmetsp:Transcript_13127/g.22179  ORF Transcript_13127/g.22179 Transcript_13127/m.22179 type:complete len:170 (+) Transcript_13127:1228-1737(+)
MGSCTQKNFLTAIERFNAPIIGFANEDLSHSQVFNCHKLLVHNAGVPIHLKSLETPEDDSLAQALSKLSGGESEYHRHLIHNVTFYHKLLSEDERLSKMDLQYWLDFVYLFGVEEMIPLYDKMHPFSYRNYDVYLLAWAIFFTLLYLLTKLCKCCGRMCCKSEAKSKQD